MQMKSPSRKGRKKKKKVPVEQKFGSLIALTLSLVAIVALSLVGRFSSLVTSGDLWWPLPNSLFLRVLAAGSSLSTIS